MVENKITKKGDFVEIAFTGYANGNVFDSNIEPIESINMTNWNNGNQILAYQEFTNNW